MSEWLCEVCRCKQQAFLITLELLYFIWCFFTFSPFAVLVRFWWYPRRILQHIFRLFSLSLSFAGVRLPNRLAVEQMTQSSPTLECRLSSRSPREKSEREKDFETEYKVCAQPQVFGAKLFCSLAHVSISGCGTFFVCNICWKCLSAKSVVVFLFTHCFKIEFLLFITFFSIVFIMINWKSCLLNGDVFSVF